MIQFNFSFASTYFVRKVKFRGVTCEKRKKRGLKKKPTKKGGAKRKMNHERLHSAQLWSRGGKKRKSKNPKFPTNPDER